MKKLGQWLLRNNIYTMTLIFMGVAVWAGLRWEQLAWIQKLNLGAYLCLFIHEYEEEYKDRFCRIFAVPLGIDPTEAIATGQSHIAQACAITLWFCLGLCFPNVPGLTFAGFILCIFEGGAYDGHSAVPLRQTVTGVVHGDADVCVCNMGNRLFQPPRHLRRHPMAVGSAVLCRCICRNAELLCPLDGQQYLPPQKRHDCLSTLEPTQ